MRTKTHRFLIALIAIILTSIIPPGHHQANAALVFEEEIGPVVLMMEFELFYLPLGLVLPLASDSIPRLETDSELEIYGYLLTRFFLPRTIVIEGSIYPMPLLGAGIRKYAPEFYADCEIFEGFNIIQSITSSFFEEPWAASVFFGNVVAYAPAGRPASATNSDTIQGKGYSGLVTSYGNWHIRDNEMIRDDWLEIELKLKGEIIDGKKTISWSYKIGTRLHSNDDIKSWFYLGLRRDHTDFDFHDFTLFENSFAELLLRLENETARPQGIRFVFGKKFPLRDSPLLPELNIGFQYNFRSPYTGELVPEDQRFHLVISPNLRF
ncbi:MAG TPA: hypothetical protein PLD82_01910 [Spirochaetota bacterium]|nr:hypothetical protein [Spirochaetota bacterium]HPH03522.1 hypothetical protein [Spirochaetota bacterium]